MPLERREVHEHGSGGVGDIGDVDAAAAGAAGEVVEEPAVDRPGLLRVGRAPVDAGRKRRAGHSVGDGASAAAHPRMNLMASRSPGGLTMHLPSAAADAIPGTLSMSHLSFMAEK